MSDDAKTFRYHDGAGEVHGDPTALRWALINATGGHLNAMLRDYYASDNARRRNAPLEQQDAADLASARAASVLLPAVRAAFRLASFDPATGKGATDDDADRVLCEFQDYLAGVKKKRESLPWTPPPTTSTPPPSAPKSA